MALALLRRIADARRFPVVLISDADIEGFRTLLLAGHVVGVMQVTFDPLGGGPQPGIVVTEVTDSGRLALESFGGGQRQN